MILICSFLDSLQVNHIYVVYNIKVIYVISELFKLGFYTYTLEDIYKRIDDIIALDYFLVITPVCIQLQYIKNDDIYHAETTTDDNMLETAYNMLLWVLKNILGREIK